MNGAETLQSSDTDLLYTQARFFLDLHEAGINYASLFWGRWLFPMDYLIFKSNFLPKFLSVLLIIGCFGYLTDFVLFFLYPESDVTIGQFTGWGEILFPLWLLIKGINAEQWVKCARKPA